MNMKSSRKLSWLVVLSLAVAFLAGCASTPTNWDSRVGHYTVDQAKANLGTPASETRLNNGDTKCVWFMHPYAGSAQTGLQPYNFNTTMGANPSFGPQLHNQVLTLTFDTNNVLTAWSKNY